MPPRAQTRYALCSAIVDEDGDLVLTDPEPYQYQPLGDNVTITTIDGDTWMRLAWRLYGRADWYWVIVDFMGVVDPTLAIPAGTVVTAPSLRAVTEIILNEQRRKDYQS